MKWFKKRKKEQPVTDETINRLINLDEDELHSVINEIDNVRSLPKWKIFLKMKDRYLGLLVIVMVIMTFTIFTLLNIPVWLNLLTEIMMLFLEGIIFYFYCADVAYNNINGQSIQARSLENLLGIRNELIKYSYKVSFDYWIFNLLQELSSDSTISELLKNDIVLLKNIRDTAGQYDMTGDTDIRTKFLKIVMPLLIFIKRSDSIDMESYETIMKKYGIRSQLEELDKELRSKNSEKNHEIVMELNRARSEHEGRNEKISEHVESRRLMDVVKRVKDNKTELDTRLEEI